MSRTMVFLAAVVLAAMAVGCGGVASAEFTGHIVDAQCAGNGEVNAQCAQDCIKGGEPAVLVTAAGKIYEIANQDKVIEHAGHKVTITGSENDGKITAESVKMGD
jgi:hypothetical protein